MSAEEEHGYEHISISWGGASVSGRTSIHVVTSNSTGAYLGDIKWFGRWRQYCFFPGGNSVFSAGCLADIASFIDALRKAKAKALTE